jgi:hypothetical protein
MAFDDTIPPDVANNKIRDTTGWEDFYKNVKEELPPNAPEPRGRAVKQTVFVDSDLAGCTLTRHSRSGIIMFLNRSVTSWTSKHQDMVKPSTYAAKLNALKHAAEIIEAQRYKLRMMGVPIDGPAEVQCNNKSVVYSTSPPKPPL